LSWCDPRKIRRRATANPASDDPTGILHPQNITDPGAFQGDIGPSGSGAAMREAGPAGDIPCGREAAGIADGRANSVDNSYSGTVHCTTNRDIRDPPKPDENKEYRMTDKIVGSVMVVGGGIAGMQAALDLADSGYFVHLVEKSSAIGGVMSELDKTFPTNDCAM
jgi:NADPH-dependent 2,4-dienoyl-CoA reductase/sulfur reductase-like enzyme